MYKDKSLNKNLRVENYYMGRNGPLYATALYYSDGHLQSRLVRAP